MASTLPTLEAAPAFKFFCDLDGVSYGLAFHWNADASMWFLDVSASDDSMIRAGIRVTVDAALGGRCLAENFWPGVLIAQDTTGKHADPQRDDLATGRVVLLYFSTTEL